MSRHCLDVVTSSVDVATLPQCHSRRRSSINSMSRHRHVDVMTLELNVMTLGKFLEPISRHCCQCRDIGKAFSSFRILLVFLLFISAYFIHACEYKFKKNEVSQFKHGQ